MPNYDPLLKRIAELTAKASPGPWKLADYEYASDTDGGYIKDIASFPCCEMWGEGVEERAQQGRANAALAAPVHEMAACVVALVDEIYEHNMANERAGVHCSCNSCTALAELAAAWGVETP